MHACKQAAATVWIRSGNSGKVTLALAACVSGLRAAKTKNGFPERPEAGSEFAQLRYERVEECLTGHSPPTVRETVSDSNLQRLPRCVAASGCSCGRLWFRELRGDAQTTGQGVLCVLRSLASRSDRAGRASVGPPPWRQSGAFPGLHMVNTHQKTSISMNGLET